MRGVVVRMYGLLGAGGTRSVKAKKDYTSLGI